MDGLIALGVIIGIFAAFYAWNHWFLTKRFKDPVFGTLESFHSSWHGEVHFPPDDVEVRVWMESEDLQPPTAEHHRFWHGLVETYPARRKVLLDHVRRFADPDVVLGDGIDTIRLVCVELPMEGEDSWSLELVATDGPYRYRVDLEMEGESIVEMNMGHEDDATRLEADRRVCEAYDI